jgi:hypothetical protein
MREGKCWPMCRQAAARKDATAVERRVSRNPRRIAVKGGCRIGCERRSHCFLGVFRGVSHTRQAGFLGWRSSVVLSLGGAPRSKILRRHGAVLRQKPNFRATHGWSTVTWPRAPARSQNNPSQGCFTSFPEPVPCTRTLPRINSWSRQPRADGALDARDVSRLRE